MRSTPPTTPPPRARRRAASLVLVNTGDGKGKSTAALGTALRALARGWRVCVVQFVKSGRFRTGEERLLRELGATWHTTGDGFTWVVDDLARSAELARAAWATAREAIASGAFDLVLLDEVTYPCNWGWIDEEEVLAAIASRPPGVNVIVTGRDASEALVAIADTVTEMVKVKHAFDAGIAARRGIDF
ncbi:MAG TPA: cob(I)yrinic acid a,c-diamide adenosyltransferase [Acidimicrobiales bacterium]|nr:cob(I)yrinic acid a,c-diamide adenosyltransferase [Acidimicrobiales bacterium]